MRTYWKYLLWALFIGLFIGNYYFYNYYYVGALFYILLALLLRTPNKKFKADTMALLNVTFYLSAFLFNVLSSYPVTKLTFIPFWGIVYIAGMYVEGFYRFANKYFDEKYEEIDTV